MVSLPSATHNVISDEEIPGSAIFHYFASTEKKIHPGKRKPQNSFWNCSELLHFLQLIHFQIEGFATEGEGVFVTAGFDVLIAFRPPQLFSRKLSF